MRLWPFPKKSESEELSTSCDLPDGVMLAAPDTPTTQEATVPSYAMPDNGQPMLDPAAGLEQPESPLFAPRIKKEQESPFTDDFNQLFAPGKPLLSAPPTEALDFGLPMSQPQQSSPLPKPAALSSALSESLSSLSPLSNDQQQQSLEELLAKLGPAPKPEADLAGLASLIPESPVSMAPTLDFQAPEPAIAPLEKTAPALEDNWSLDLTTAPPLSSDWSLVSADISSPAIMEPMSPYSPADLQPDDLLAPPDMAYGLPEEPKQPLDMPMLEDCLTNAMAAAMPEADHQSMIPAMDNLAAANLDAPLPSHQPSAPKAAAPATTSMLDTLIPPPPKAVGSDAVMPPSPMDAHGDATGDAIGFGLIPDWNQDAGFGMPSVPQGADDFDGFSMLGPAIMEPTAPELSNSNPTKGFGDFDLPEAEPEQSPLAALGFSPEDLELEEEDDSWASSEDAISESAELNSSSTAYDFNHYDDPDEPSPAFELEEELDDSTSAHNLQAMADMLSQLRPSKPAAEPPKTRSDIPPIPLPEAETPAWDTMEMVPSAMEDWDAVPAASIPNLDTPANYTPKPIHSANLEAAYVADNRNGHAAETHHGPMASAYLEIETIQAEVQPFPMESIEAQEEQMLTLNGLKADPDKSLLENISAKFIARPRQESPNTHASDMPCEVEPYSAKAATPPVEELMIDPSGLLDQMPASKQKAPTLSQAMSNFEEEMMLRETRFIKQSINNLVDTYFAQQERDSSY